jgi:outer membrane protein OmpA-like peptidoglycan-associated protein
MASCTRPAGLAALLLALAAGCSGGDDDAGRDPGSPGDGGAGTELGTGDGGDGAQTRLDVDRSDSASALERRVSETLSELDAEQRGADTVVTLPDRVLFAFGEHVLLPEAVPVLDQLVEVMEHHDGAPVLVHGHTDAVGSDASNQALSDRRSQAVVDHLVSRGIDPARLQAQGFGESQPVAPNSAPDGADDPDGRARNRRVEIVLEGVDLTASTGA